LLRVDNIETNLTIHVLKILTENYTVKNKLETRIKFQTDKCLIKQINLLNDGTIV